MNNKNKRRTIAVILAAVLAAGVFAGCGKSKEPIKIEIGRAHV